jgi:hypothetical protein
MGCPPAGVVERWESYATPPGDIVLAAATLAQEIPGDMLALPLNEGAGRKAAMVSAIGPVLDSMGDSSVISYTDRSLVTQDQWNGIIRGASDCLWLYGMAEYGYAADPETHGIIRDAVAAGCSVRVLLLDPEYAATRDIDADEGNPAGMLRRESARRWTCSPRCGTTCPRCRSASTTGTRACR